MTRLWLVRHGPTHVKRLYGWTDLPADLSDQAALDRLSDALPKAPLGSSDLARARDTATAISDGRPRLAEDARWREMHFGDWENLAHSQIDPEASRAFWDNPGTTRPPGGESWDDLTARIATALTDIPADGEDQIIVCHFGAIMAALAVATGMSARTAFGFRVAPLSVTRLDRLKGGAWAVDRVNHNP